MLIFALILTIYAGSALAAGSSNSGTNDPSDRAGIVKQIEQLEGILLDTNVNTRRSSPKETRQNLEILREMYYQQPRVVKRIQHLDELLKASSPDGVDCVTRQIDSLISLYKDHSEQPNLEIYMGEQVRRQLVSCKYYLEENIPKLISQVGIFNRNKVTKFRQIAEKGLDKSSPIKELWQCKGPEKVKLFNQAMIDYVHSTIGLKFDDLQDLREQMSSKLASACKAVQTKLQASNERFQQIIQFDTNFNDVTRSWMSSFALCDYYIRDSFDWKVIYDRLTIEKMDEEHTSHGSHCGLTFFQTVGRYIS